MENESLSSIKLQNRKNMLIPVKNKENFTNTITQKKRNPYVDCIRILGMYSIIIHHILYHGKALIKYSQYNQLSLMNIFSFWHVSSFALISGIVGYKTNKYSNLLFLWLCTLFYSIIIHSVFKIFKPIYVQSKSILTQCFPFVFSKYWYMTKYFGMYLFLPLINNGIANISKGDLNIIIFSFLGIYIVWKDYMTQSDPFVFKNGYSIIWLLVFYITGAYFGKYKIIINLFLFKLIFCCTCIIVFLGSSLLCFYLSIYNGEYRNYGIIIKMKRLFSRKINSLAMILQAISITLFFSQIKYHKFIGKIITFLGPLTFGVYLIHEHEYIRSNYISNLFDKDPQNLSLTKVVFLVLYRGLLIFIICSIIDYFRHLLFIICKIRKICVLLEKSVKKVFN